MWIVRSVSPRGSKRGVKLLRFRVALLLIRKRLEQGQGVSIFSKEFFVG